MSFQSKYNEKKATEAACILLDLKEGQVEYMWLLKMLYIIDRESFIRWERPITYDYYKSMPRGPVPMNTYNLIRGWITGVMWKRYINTLRSESAKRFDVQLRGSVPKPCDLSESEINLIKEKFNEFKDFDQWDLVEFTHEFFPEWEDPKDGPHIPIKLDNLLKKSNFKSEDIERIKTELRNEEAIDAMFGG